MKTTATSQETANLFRNQIALALIMMLVLSCLAIASYLLQRPFIVSIASVSVFWAAAQVYIRLDAAQLIKLRIGIFAVLGGMTIVVCLMIIALIIHFITDTA